MERVKENMSMSSFSRFMVLANYSRNINSIYPVIIFWFQVSGVRCQAPRNVEVGMRNAEK